MLGCPENWPVDEIDSFRIESAPGNFPEKQKCTVKKDLIVCRLEHRAELMTFVSLISLRFRFRVELPLIRCCVFTRITKLPFVKVLNTPGIICFVRFAQNLVFVPDREIQLLQDITQERRAWDVEPISWQRGNLVEITSGGLIGVIGIFAPRDQKKKVVFGLTNTGFALRQEVEPTLLRHGVKEVPCSRHGGESP